MLLKGKWIWLCQDSHNPYNQTIIVRKNVKINSFKKAICSITADSFYRLFINGIWVNDGPCRSWPENFQYDKINVKKYLRNGINELKIIARYFGVGTFHQIPQQAGLLFQFDIESESGKIKTFFSDETWESALAREYVSNTPKVSPQMEAAEYYDARFEDQKFFSKSSVLFNTYDGPWQGLMPRDVPLMTKKIFFIKSFISSKIIKTQGQSFCIPFTRIVFPNLIEANLKVCPSGGIATNVNIKKQARLELSTEGFDFSVDGIRNPEGKYTLNKGNHLILAFVKAGFTHIKDKIIHLKSSEDYILTNPVEKNNKNPWSLIQLNDYAFHTNDIIWIDFIEDDLSYFYSLQKYRKLTEKFFKDIINQNSLIENLSSRIYTLPSEEMFVKDEFWKFENKEFVADGLKYVSAPNALLDDSQNCTSINPIYENSIELLYDLGEQNCGYCRFDLIAEEGVQIDIAMVEHISQNGIIQHTKDNRNGFTYITRQGSNRYTSIKRRSGRYLFITLRNQKSVVKIKNVQLIESTYPIKDLATANFECSDHNLNSIWDISVRTLKLCMEDTFTDCPLYEQTLWVGDARNEALFSYYIFGITDISKRCIRLAAGSLKENPMVACQVPSSWQCILPAWSFLWVISIWDYYWYTDDKEFIKDIWPYIILNLKGASKYINEQNLFSGPFWNMFDWAPRVNQNQYTVIHNSMFFIGAIDSALKCSSIIKNEDNNIWLKDTRNKLKEGINNLWNSDNNSYPDSINRKGHINNSFCQHTSFLSVLYDIIESKNLNKAMSNILNPSKEITPVGSPFAMFYLYETLEKLGFEDQVISSIKKNYLPMIESEATTVWETYPGSLDISDGPTRSHCHAWSSSPIYFFSRIILGLKSIEAGSKTVQLSPRLNGLKWAKGSLHTIFGQIKVSWEIDKDKNLKITYDAPKQVKIIFIRNETHENMRILLVNDKRERDLRS